MEMVLEPDAEAVGHDDHRLVGEAHAGRERSSVAPDEVGGLMDRKTDAVAGPVRQAGKPVVRPKPRPLEHRPRGGVDVLARHPGPRRVEGRLLRLLLQRPDRSLFVARLAEHIGTGDIAVIAFDGAAGVDQHHVAFLEVAFAGKTVREGGGAAELDDAEAAARGAQRPVSLVDEAADFAGADAVAEDTGGAALHLQGHFLGLAHQAKLGGRFEHPTAVDYAGTVDQLDRRRGLAKAVDEQESHGRIDRQGRDLPFAERVGQQRRRALILFPKADVRLDGEIRLQRPKLETRADDDGIADKGQQHRDQPLTRAPGHAREIPEARAGTDEQRIGPVVSQQAPRLLEPALAFQGTNGGRYVRPGHERLQLGDNGRAPNSFRHATILPKFEAER